MFIIQNKFTKDFIDENGDWTMIRSLAKRFPSKEAIMKWIKSDDYKGSVLHCEPEFLKIVKEDKMQSFKQYLKESTGCDKESYLVWNDEEKAYVHQGHGFHKNKEFAKKFTKDEAEKYVRENGGEVIKESVSTTSKKEIANKLSESFPAAPSISGAFDDDEKYNKYTKDTNEWKSKCQDKCNTLVAKIRRMAERFGADILDSVRNSLSNEQRTEALNELERIYNDLDKLMDKTKIKKN